jgi:hypothetical protein
MLGIDEGALEGAGEKAGLPILGILDRHSAGAHGDEAGQVFVLSAEAVEHPGTEARPGLHAIAAIHEHEGRLVVGHLCVHRTDHGDVIGMGGGFGEEVADFETAGSVLAEGKRRRKCRAGFALSAQVFAGKGFPRVFGQHRFGIERVDV